MTVLRDRHCDHFLWGSCFFLFLKYILLTLCKDVVLICMSVPHVCAWCLQKPEKNVGSPWARATDISELPCKC